MDFNYRTYGFGCRILYGFTRINAVLFSKGVGLLDHDEKLDASGCVCPLPLLKMKQKLSRMPASTVLLVITTDKASVRDFSVFLNQVEHSLIKLEETGKEYRFWIKKGNK